MPAYSGVLLASCAEINGGREAGQTDCQRELSLLERPNTVPSMAIDLPGIELLSLCEAHEGPVDLLLTDVVMPQMGGRHLSDYILELRPATRVLFMSGHTDDTIAHHGVLESGIRLLPKPFTPDVLARRVRQVLDKDKSKTGAHARIGPAARILVVEDEDTVRVALTRALQDAGYQVVGVSELATAKARLSDNPRFDVMLLDLSLSDGSGGELYEWLETVHPKLAKRTLLVTGGATTPEDQLFLTNHRGGKIEKPFDVPVLINAVARIVALL